MLKASTNVLHFYIREILLKQKNCNMPVADELSGMFQ